MPANETLTDTPISTCAICHGTGTDPDFGGACACEQWLSTTTVNQAIARRVGSAGAPSVVSVSGARNEVDRYAAPARRSGSGRSAARPVVPATDRQVAYLRRLVDERVGSDAPPVVAARAMLDSNAPIGKREASQMIDAVQAVRVERSAAPARPAERSNRYADDCRRCGSTVAAEAGLLIRTEGGWKVEHRDGECVERPAPVELPDVPAGHYAIESTGDNDLAFYRVDRPTEGRYAGMTFVKLVVGGRPDSRVARSHVPGILARIAADPLAATRYGQQIGRCWVCNRHLTDEASRAAGIGPDCATRHG